MGTCRRGSVRAAERGLAQAPRVALLIAGLGRDRIDTVRAITGTPPETSLSFAADTPELSAWIAAARAYGHEALVDLPLDQPASADGLAVERTPAENLRRLDALLARAPLAAGIAVSGGDLPWRMPLPCSRS